MLALHMASKQIPENVIVGCILLELIAVSVN